MLNDRRFWGHASGLSSSGKTLHRFIHYWHAHAARRSALPRERLSPLALFGHAAISELSLLSGVKRKSDFEPANGSFWRRAVIPNIGCVRCGTCYEIEMISSF